MNNITIAVTFPRNEMRNDIGDISRWRNEFEKLLTIQGIDYDMNWTDQKSRIEFTGIINEEEENEPI
jgi:hypothetical protein